MKILVLVLAKDASPWSEIELNGQEVTWKTANNPDIQVLRYVGVKNRRQFKMYISELYWKINHRKLAGKLTTCTKEMTKRFNQYLNSVENQTVESAGTLKIQVDDRYFLIGLKTLAAFEYVLSQYQFDFLYRTNISSYIDLDGLFEFAISLPQDDVYAGPLAKHNGIDFASGSGYFLSRSLLARILDSSDTWNHLEIDDVALGQVVSNLGGVKRVNIKRIDFSDAHQVEKMDSDLFNSVFHYRCKNIDANETIEVMKKIYIRKMAL